MDWKKIKEGAKEKINGHLWDVWKPTLVISFISFIITFIAMLIFGEKSAATSLISSALEFVLIPASVGMYAYMLKFVRGGKYDLSDLKSYYDKFVPIIIMTFLIALFTMLGMILLIIPGIIIALGYTMALWIFADNKELEPTACMKKSREMMNGYKWDYFCFMFSFIGWILLCAFVIPMIWVVPYLSTAEAMYYDELQKKTK